ncbi:hypothetical protein OG778_21890 [Streptomyces sp. NBC_00184]|uniref:hypothetical protein n=1 Tax=Streptomyces sp. NBC_00184 TaxID=2975673 RepID=UPI002E2C1291|nr:hypothetical protein [Streptomyces sp. NBC_00184]
MISVVTAEILPAAALDATSGVADEPVDEYGSKSSRFEDPRYDAERDAAPTLPFMECLFEYQSASQQDAALRERQTAARQAEIQAKGTLAITFGLLGVAFAVCSVVAGRAVVGPGRTPPRYEAALRLSQHRGAVAESGERPCEGGRRWRRLRRPLLIVSRMDSRRKKVAAVAVGTLHLKHAAHGCRNNHDGLRDASPAQLPHPARSDLAPAADRGRS